MAHSFQADPLIKLPKLWEASMPNNWTFGVIKPLELSEDESCLSPLSAAAASSPQWTPAESDWFFELLPLVP